MMSTNTKTLSIRLAATGGEQLRRDFHRVGTEGKRAFDKIHQATQPATLGVKAVDAAARSLNRVFRDAATLIGAYAGIRGITRSFGFLVNTNREFEKLHASLKTVTGSLKGADDAFAMIEDFASKTPFSVEQLTEAFIKLKALGLDPSADALRSYGNTASAMSKDLLLFVDAVANATTGRFMNLKTFGINAQVQGDKVAFTFNKVTTAVNKNVTEIEHYLRRIGNTQFAGAMKEQMDILDGIFSNINDNLSRIARQVGQGGFTKALHDVAVSFRDATDDAHEAAHAVGETLGNVIRVTANALGFLCQHAKLAADGLTALLIARTVAKAISLMGAAMTGNAGAIVGLRLMAGISTTAAIKMVALEGATKLATVAMMGLRGVLNLLGGPTGLIGLAGFMLYKLASGHVSAAKAATDHADTLTTLREKLANTTQDIEKLNAASRDEAIARLTEQLAVLNSDVTKVTQQLTYQGRGYYSIWNQFHQFSSQSQVELTKLRAAFKLSKLSIDQYHDAIWKLAVTYPGFTKQAKAIDQQLGALKKVQKEVSKTQHALAALRDTTTHKANSDNENATIVPVLGDKQKEKIEEMIAELTAEQAALARLVTARKQGNDAVQRAITLNEQENMLHRVGIDLHQQQSKEALGYAKRIRDLVKQKVELQAADKNAIDAAKHHEAAIQSITQAYNGLKSESEQAILRANAWRDSALAGLDKTRQGYAAFAEQIEAVYQHLLREAREQDLQDSKRWQDGLTRGLHSVVSDAADMASQVEHAVTDAFSNMEDALVEFVTHGKLDFKSLADSIIADIVRIQLRKTVIAPLASALGSINVSGLFSTAHTGGVIGHDNLGHRAINPAVFNNAPKFHSGGVVGNDVPIIAKKGETVFTPGQMRLLNAGLSNRNSNTNVTVHVHNNAPGVHTKTQSSRLPNGDIKLDIMVEQLEQQLTRHVTRGQGLAPVLERRYGLNPAAGSYR